MLTKRETQVVYYICKNYKYAMIAQELGLSFETIKTYVNRIRKKLNVNSKVGIVLWAKDNKLFED